MWEGRQVQMVWTVKRDEREMILSHRVWNSDFHTTTKRQACYYQFVIPISTIPITKHPFFLIFSETFSLLPNALLSPLEFSALPLPDLSSWSHGSLSPKGFSSIEVWSLKELGFESVDFRSDLGLKIWVLFGFGNNKVLKFEVGIWFYLWGFGWFC